MFQTFVGNTNAEDVVRHELDRPILARYIRFIPVVSSKEGRIGVRLELYGCSHCKYRVYFLPDRPPAPLTGSNLIYNMKLLQHLAIKKTYK